MGRMAHLIWLSHMKTTVELPAALLAEAKRLTRRDGTTLRELLEDGLRAAIEARKGRQRFVLRNASVGGDGLAPEIAAGGWDAIRARIYSGHGG